jgi:hypothetical protein
MIFLHTCKNIIAGSVSAALGIRKNLLLDCRERDAPSMAFLYKLE